MTYYIRKQHVKFESIMEILKYEKVIKKIKPSIF